MFTRRNSKQKKKETVPKKRNIRASPRPEILLNRPPKTRTGIQQNIPVFKTV
jgi:hypothetical protein